MNPSTALARVLIDELVRGGVREVVLAPGSRSAPLAYAVQQAEREGRLRLHVRVDERTAGFLALGLAKGSRTPVPVITTSGTAVANLHPAVLEAHHTGVPLVVLSADRPRSCGGPAPTRRRCSRGSSARRSAGRWTCRHPEQLESVGAFHRTTVCRALSAALGATLGGPRKGAGGPVHLNVPSVTRSHPSRTARESSIRAGPTGVPGSGSHCRAGTPTSRCRPPRAPS